MNVKELIDVLLDFDPEAPVRLVHHSYNGRSLYAPEEVWRYEEGQVVIE
jgi:hypothetical protein